VPEPLPDLRVTHYSHTVPGCYCTELGVNTTGAAISWAVKALGYTTYGELTADARRCRQRLQRAARPGGGGRSAGATTPADAADAAPLFLPYLGDGERDDPSARAGFIGLSDRHGRPELAFAVIEGVALGVRAVLQVLERAGSPLAELRVGGGGARLDLSGQIKADLLGRPVLHLDLDPAGFGAAILAAAAAGMPAEADDATRAVRQRARRFLPSRWGSQFELHRAAWFDQVRTDAAVHKPREPT